MGKNNRSRNLGLVAGAGAAAFGVLTTLTTDGHAGWFDWRARQRLRRRSRGRLAAVARWQGHLGTERVHAPLALIGAAALAIARRKRAGGAVAASSLGAVALSHLFERMMPKRFAPPGKHKLRDPSYPSGHTLETASLTWVTVYALAREGLLDGRTAVAIGLLVPLAAAAGRVYLDRHWVSDVLGGAAAATAYAAAVGAIYESAGGRA